MRWFVRKSDIDFCETGWGNGYVLLPPDHEYFGKSYDEINNHVDVHYGLTYGGLVNDKMIDFWQELTKEDEGMWCIGFDTAHYEDTLLTWPKEAVEKEAEQLFDQLTPNKTLNQLLKEI